MNESERSGEKSNIYTAIIHCTAFNFMRVFLAEKFLLLTFPNIFPSSHKRSHIKHQKNLLHIKKRREEEVSLWKKYLSVIFQELRVPSSMDLQNHLCPFDSLSLNIHFVWTRYWKTWDLSTEKNEGKKIVISFFFSSSSLLCFFPLKTGKKRK